MKVWEGKFLLFMKDEGDDVERAKTLCQPLILRLRFAISEQR